MHTAQLSKRLQRALGLRQERRRRRAKRAHGQDVASRGRDHVDVATRHWQGGGGAT